MSALDLHEFGGDQDALRPDPVWMAIRQLVERIERLAIVQRFQGWTERRSEREVAPSEPIIAEGNALAEDVSPPHGHVMSRS